MSLLILKSLLAVLLVIGPFVAAREQADARCPMDGVHLRFSDRKTSARRWNISTGNLSVQFIRMSPIGADPQPGYQMEPPPGLEKLRELKRLGLDAYEDYVTWGAVEREPGKWDWRQHDAVCETVKKAGLRYFVYCWIHFPPVWLRSPAGAGSHPDFTLMRCMEHGIQTNYLSIFDPQTIAYYDRFYCELSRHFGSRVDGVYACILGPYGEGNYPIAVPDWVNMGHCHEGYWCADPYALAAFRDAMRKRYRNIGSLNTVWGTPYRSFSELRPPEVISEGFRPSPDAFKNPGQRRQWLDFIIWYHQAIIDFAEKSIQVTLKYFPREKVRAKPGGSAGGVNPISWGTYCPGYARMAAPYRIVLQPADCHGAYFGDKWIATAYRFYGVRESTEPAGGLDAAAFVRRIFSDASCGASELFTYEFEQHAADIERYIHLLAGRSGDTDVAVLCPTTLYRLGADLSPSIRAADGLRDLTDFDVLDELLISDGALDRRRYRLLIAFQLDWTEQKVLDKIERWIRGGGIFVITSVKPVRNVEGAEWYPEEWKASDGILTCQFGRGVIVRHYSFPEEGRELDAFRALLIAREYGSPDGVWITRRGREIFMLNTKDVVASCEMSVAGKLYKIEIPPHSIYELRPRADRLSDEIGRRVH